MNKLIVFKQKVTKQFIFSLEAGLWLSLGVNSDFSPKLAQAIPYSQKEKEKLWEDIKSLRLDQRIGVVFKCKWHVDSDTEDWRKKYLHRIVETEPGTFYFQM